MDAIIIIIIVIFPMLVVAVCTGATRTARPWRQCSRNAKRSTILTRKLIASKRLMKRWRVRPDVASATLILDALDIPSESATDIAHHIVKTWKGKFKSAMTWMMKMRWISVWKR